MSIVPSFAQPQKKQSIDDYIEYATRFTGYTDSIIITKLCSSSQNIINNRQSLSTMLDSRKIYLYTEIQDTIANIIQSLLFYYDSLNDNDIEFNINSNGGGVYAGLGIYDAMQFTKSDIVTINRGITASMASVILASGTKGKRFGVIKGKIMIHNPYVNNKYITDNQELLKIKTEILQIFIAHTQQTKETIDLDMEHTRWFNARDAIEYGLIDNIITND